MTQPANQPCPPQVIPATWDAYADLGVTWEPRHPITGRTAITVPSVSALCAIHESLPRVQEVSAKLGDAEWCSMSPEDALAMARSGWDEGAATVGRFDTAHLPLSYESPAMSWSPSGGCVDVGAMLAGEPDCMGLLEPTPAADGAIRILINPWIQWSVPQAWVTDRTMRLARLILAMVRADIPVEVLYCDPSEMCDTNVTLVTHDLMIYKTGDVLNMSQLAYWLGHVGAIRRLWYAANIALYSGRQNNKRLDRDADSKILSNAASQKCIYIKSALGGGYNLAEAEQDWIAQAKNLAGEL